MPDWTVIPVSYWLIKSPFTVRPEEVLIFIPSLPPSIVMFKNLRFLLLSTVMGFEVYAPAPRAKAVVSVYELPVPSTGMVKVVSPVTVATLYPLGSLPAPTVTSVINTLSPFVIL